MNAPNKPMTVDAFIAWAMQQERGRFELLRGEIVPMAPERTGHMRVKARAFKALEDAVRTAGVACHVLPNGATVRIDEHTAFEPDALVYCGSQLDDDTIVIPAPVIVVEVLSPSSTSIDTGDKVTGYFTVPSIRHYLIADGRARSLVHHHRLDDGTIRSQTVTEGTVRLEPPGLALPLAAFFPPA